MSNQMSNGVSALSTFLLMSLALVVIAASYAIGNTNGKSAVLHGEYQFSGEFVIVNLPNGKRVLVPAKDTK